MEGKYSKKRAALTLGILLGGFHLLWALCVALAPAMTQKALNWVFTIHSIQPPYRIIAFNLLNSIYLVVFTFIVGLIIGWLGACLLNWLNRKVR